jgi:hypothetical protein
MIKCLINATTTNFIVSGLTRSGLELTIYRTREKHANHYTTNAVTKVEKIKLVENNEVCGDKMIR